MKFITLFVATLFCGSASAQTLKINEIMQSNVETIMDDIHEFPDSWVELYNPSDQAVNLKDYQISNKNKVKKAWQLPDKTVAAKGYVIIYCDKEGIEDKRLHADFRLESGKGCTVYLFKDKKSEPVDSLPADMKKMPAPDIAYGRETDGADKWGYQLTPTPGKANCGKTTKNILGAPVFSEKGRVSNTALNLTLTLPEGAPDGAYIAYTTDGSEPKANSKKYSNAINISKTTVIRAKVFCNGYLSPVSTAQSYIFHPRTMTVPIFSVQIDDRYLNGGDSLGLFKYNNSKEDKKTCDWRRPMNIEFFPTENAESAFNQLGETRIQGGQSRSNALKSMVFYANKRFDPDKKRYSYEFFPDQKPGITEFKSFSLRDGGNDFSDLYFRDLIIQRTMAGHADLDWQAGHTAVLYINGEYMGMLNIRERSNEDNIYSNYNGLEDIDIVEISHEKINNKDMFEEEFKEGTADFYEAFKTFYSEKGHTLAEYENWLDVSEYLNVIVMNFFYGNIDFPGNNIVFWRPNDDDKDSGLPKRFRVIVKDTDFGLGLYGRQNDYNTIKLLYNPSYDSSNAWAFTEPATRLLKNMLEDPDILKMFIDKCSVFMGDFLNGKGTAEVIDLIMAEAMEEFVAHRNKYNAGWGPWQTDNRADITNKFNSAKSWAEGRPKNFYKFIGDQWKLGSPVALTVNKTAQDVALTINGINVSNKTFDGKFFANRELVITGTAPEGQEVKGWKLSGGKTGEVSGSQLTLSMTSSALTIEPVLGMSTGIQTVQPSAVSRQPSPIYDLMGNKVKTPKAGRIYIQNGKKISWR